MKHLIITRPDDWHVHLRDGDMLPHTVPSTERDFARTLVMPNLKPALTSVEQLITYRERILAVSKKAYFTPYMTLYLNEDVTENELQKAASTPHILGAKLYPSGATTNSDQGATSILALYPLLESLQAHQLVLQIHGEVTHGDIFDREAHFIESYLKPISKQFPKLRMVLEHISSKAAVDFIEQSSEYIAATITPHHLMFNRNQLLVGGVKPHYYCLPILKSHADQVALQQAATSGNPKFFAGTDSAPHTVSNKESACGCAGIYSAPYALAMYAEVFNALDKLQQLDAFLSEFGTYFYQLPKNKGEIELVHQPQQIPDTLPLGTQQVVPVLAGEMLKWSVKTND
jgi:dihydroorotase